MESLVLVMNEHTGDMLNFLEGIPFMVLQDMFYGK